MQQWVAAKCITKKKNDVQILLFVVVLFLLPNYTQLQALLIKFAHNISTTTEMAN